MSKLENFDDVPPERRKLQAEQVQQETDPTHDVSQIGDSRRPLIRAARFGAIALLLVTIASLAIWGSMRDIEGIWGALIGAAIGGGFLLATVGVVLASSATSPQATIAVVLGSWILKLVVLIIILMILRDMTFYDSSALGMTVIAVLVVVLATETMAVLRTRLMYVPEN